MIARNFRKFSFAFLIFLSVCFFAPEIFAKRLPVKIYTSADGLGSSFVDYLMRDSRGFMWFCTRDTNFKTENSLKLEIMWKQK